MKVGIIGGGQLGDMMIHSGKKLGLEFAVYSPDETQSTQKAQWIQGNFQEETLLELAQHSDCITFEFEALDVSLLNRLAEKTPIYPRVNGLAYSQDRYLEKSFLNRLGIATAPFVKVDTLKDLQQGFEKFGPSIAKTRRNGYDGKGQVVLEKESDVAEAWSSMHHGDLILEQKVNYIRELSLICARNQDGATVFYPLVENTHREGILRQTIAPAPNLKASLTERARDFATKIFNELDYIGVLTLEFFETAKGLAVNEMACRVHNSGHWSIEGAKTSQFENHLRAITGKSLGSTKYEGVTVMFNLIGQLNELEDFKQLFPQAHIHLYGKSERPNRKLGHITMVFKNWEQAESEIKKVHSCLKSQLF